MQNTENFLERISSTSMFTEAGDSKFVGVATRTDKCSHEQEYENHIYEQIISENEIYVLYCIFVVNELC